MHILGILFYLLNSSPSLRLLIWLDIFGADPKYLYKSLMEKKFYFSIFIYSFKPHPKTWFYWFLEGGEHWCEREWRINCLLYTSWLGIEPSTFGIHSNQLSHLVSTRHFIFIIATMLMLNPIKWVIFLYHLEPVHYSNWVGALFICHDHTKITVKLQNHLNSSWIGVLQLE